MTEKLPLARLQPQQSGLIIGQAQTCITMIVVPLMVCVQLSLGLDTRLTWSLRKKGTRHDLSEP